MTKEQRDALKAIKKINDKLYDKYDKENDLDNMPILSLILSDSYFSIEISIPTEFNTQDVKLFNSENNDRIYYEKTDKYETFYKLIKRKFTEIKRQIYKTKLV